MNTESRMTRNENAGKTRENMRKSGSIFVDGQEYVPTHEACKLLNMASHIFYHFIQKGWCGIDCVKQNKRNFFNKTQILQTQKELKNHVYIVDFIYEEGINRDTFYRHRATGKLPKARHLNYIRYSRPSFYTKDEAKTILKFLTKLGPHAFNKKKDQNAA